MKRKFLSSLIFSIFLPCEAFCVEDIHNDDFSQNESDQSIFNEEIEKDSSDEDTVNLYQFSLESVQQLLNDNMKVLNSVEKFIDVIFQGRSGFVLKDFKDQYVCCKKIEFLSLKELQKYDENFEIVDCFIDFSKINSLKIVESTRTLFFVQSLIYEFLAACKNQRYSFKARTIVDKTLIDRVFFNQKTHQKLNRFIKDTFGVKKNFDFCSCVNFVVLVYKNTFSVEGLERLFEKYKFLENEKDFEKIENEFSHFVLDLRNLDVENDEYQSSIDIVCQNIAKNPSLLKNFLLSLVDKPLCNLRNSDIENFLHHKFQK